MGMYPIVNKIVHELKSTSKHCKACSSGYTTAITLPTEVSVLSSPVKKALNFSKELPLNTNIKFVASC